MNNASKKPKVIFFCQMAGPLFRELAQDISDRCPPCVLFTGHPDTIKKGSRVGSLYIEAGPKYQRKANLTRLLSGLHFMFRSFVKCWQSSKNSLLFLMSTPLCFGIIGYIFKQLRGQHYVVLVYDIYPDILINTGHLRKSGLVARTWLKLNELAWENADIVFAIGDKMAEKLEKRFDATKTTTGKVISIRNWADTEWIKPVSKGDNCFAKQHNQVGKLTVMYSGNLGNTHDIETILVAAKKLRREDSVHFMIIGEGAKSNIVRQAKRDDNLENLTILPFQPESVLPLSLPTADISVITLDKGGGGLSVPSKTHYYMAAGSALLGICDQNSEIAQMINKYDCGFSVRPGDVDGVVSNMLGLLNDKKKLQFYKDNSRRAAEQYHSRRNTHYYIEALAGLIN
jgi:glycosyltransferase involved in cell wall biosynthesis